MRFSKVAVALALVVSSVSAFATVTVNADGSGFVGKGDVSLQFGWNNAAAQAKSTGVSFSYSQSNTYVGVCEWYTGLNSPKGAKLHTVTQSKTSDVVSGIASDARKASQYTGWNLTGFGSVTVTGEAPVVGGTCPGEGTDGTWTTVELQSTSTKLMATSDGVSKEIPITPVALPM